MSEFSEDEKAAMRETAAERRRAKRADAAAADAQACAEKIAEMPPEERVLAQKVHDLVLAAGPDLAPKTWYGMPAYAKDGAVVVFFQAAAKFKSRYCTLGFSDSAQLDDSAVWPTSYAVTAIGPEEEALISTLVSRALRTRD